jgi:hypothetical protein
MATPEVTKKTRTLVMVKTRDDVQFLGVNGRQLTTGQGLQLTKVSKGVEVRKDGFDDVYTIYDANIAHIKETES